MKGKERRKRILLFIMAILMLIAHPASLLAERHEDRDIALPIIVNNHIVMSDVNPFIKNGRTYVPIRFIAEELGFDVEWKAESGEVKMKDGDKTVTLKIGSDVMKVGDKEYKLDAPALLKDGRTFIPLRAVAEAFGKEVNWSNDYRAIFIGENPKYNEFYNVVYYYKNQKPVISNYKINIVTYKLDDENNTKVFTNIKDMLNFVEDDFTAYYTNRSTSYKYKIYVRELSSKSNTDENTVVATEDQLKDKYYVAPESDPVEGTYYGPSLFEDGDGTSYKTKAYYYITSLGNNEYAIKQRVILASDPSSEFWLDIRATYDPSKKALYIPFTQGASYGLTDYFAQYPDILHEEGYLYFENNFTHLSWEEPGNPDIYFDKY